MVTRQVKEAEGAALGVLMAGVNQAQFAKKHAFPGGASMISQHISGHRPIHIEAARIYAEGLGVGVEKFSPRLALTIQDLQAVDSGLSDEGTRFLPGFESLSIPLLANSGSMGSGNDDLHDEVVIGRLTVSPDWARRVVKPTKLEHLRFIHGYGDSMEPTFADGDVLLVDLGVRDPKIDGVYVLEANDRIYIKRVRERMDGSLEISSDNPTVKTVDVLDGSTQVTVHGRVVWRWNGRKM